MLLGFDEFRVDVIQREYSTNEYRLQAAVEEWLEGGGLFQSWKSVVFALDHAGDTVVADSIRGFAEPPPGESS